MVWEENIPVAKSRFNLKLNLSEQRKVQIYKYRVL